MNRAAVALTGSTGFIGRAVLGELHRRDMPVRALTRRPPPPRLSADWLAGDIGDPHVWDRLLPGADVVIHLACAAMTDLGDVADNVQTNLPAFAALMAAARRHGIARVVVAGSCFEYGSTGELVTGRGLREDDPLRPTNIYGATKAAISLLAVPLAEALSLETIILRPFHVYGAGERADRIVPSVIDAALSGQAVRTTDGRQVRDFVHCDDVAAAFVEAATAPPGRPGVRVYNIGTGIATSVVDVIDTLARMCEMPAERLRKGEIAHRPHEMWRLVSDPARARDELDWSARVRLDDGLRALVASRRNGS